MLRNFFAFACIQVVSMDLSFRRYSQYSVIYPQQFRVFGGGAGPTRRGANMHLETECSRYTPMFGDA